MKTTVSYSELKTFGWCEKWYENKYVELLPVAMTWGAAFYAGTVLDEYVRAKILGKNLEEARQRRLVTANFIGMSSDKDVKSVENFSGRLVQMAEEILKLLPSDIEPGNQILEPWDLDGTGDMLVTLDGWPDFISQGQQKLFELKCQLRARSITEQIKDWFQVETYRMVYSFPVENTHLIEAVVSGAAKPKGPEYSINIMSLSQAQEEVLFNVTGEVVELFRRLVSSRDKKSYARTGIMTGACKFCSYKSHCFRGNLGTDDSE